MPLQEIYLDKVALDRCLTCGGLWFNRGELEQLSGRGLTVIPGTRRPASHRCVFCGALMQRGSFRKYVAQSCLKCDAAFLPETAVAEIAGGVMKPGHKSGTKFKVTFICASCGDKFSLQRGAAASQGLMCLSCAPVQAPERNPQPGDGESLLITIPLEVLGFVIELLLA
jgi:hypothetical protein